MGFRNLIIAVALFGVAPASVMRAQTVLDQEFTSAHAPHNLSSFVNEGRKFVGQSFTAGRAGLLRHVKMSFVRFPFAETDFEFTVRATVAGLPFGPPLATETLPF